MSELNQTTGASADRSPFIELRVHGIGSHQPYQVLGRPIRQEGDDNIGIFSLPRTIRANVHAFVWSRTTRRWLGAYRYLLLPFTLVNVAGFMHGSNAPASIKTSVIYHLMVHFIGATVTASYILWLWALLVDTPVILGAPAAWHSSAYYAILVLVAAPIVVRMLRSMSQTPKNVSLDESPVEGVGDDRFWKNEPVAGLFYSHLITTIILLTLPRALFGATDSLILLFVIQVLCLLCAGSVAHWRALQNSQPSRVGGVFALILAVALPHIVFGALQFGIAWIAWARESGWFSSEEVRMTAPAVPGLIVLGRNNWQFICTYCAFALFFWFVIFMLRVRSTSKLPPSDINACASEYGVQFEKAERWLLDVTWKRRQVFIQKIPQSLLDRPGYWLLSLAFLTTLGANALEIDTTNGGLHPLANHVWNGEALFIFLVVLYLFGRLIFSSAARQRAAGLYDILGYWPRRHHPLSPPPYAGITTEKLTAALTRYVETHERCVVVGHSQGSVLAYTALCRAQPQIKAQIDLVTCGSPLGSLYATSFPAYFSSTDFSKLRGELQTWTNLYRDTDPIGTPIFPLNNAGQADVRILEPAAGVGKPIGHSGYWDDPKMLEQLQRLFPTASMTKDR